jgi:hypothetical protein
MLGTGRRRWLLAALGVALVLGAVPVTAFVIIPIFAQSTLNEPAPRGVASPSASGAASPGATVAATPVPRGPQQLAAGALQRIDTVHYGSGQVLMVEADGARYVRFQDVNIAAAPNLYVYLSDRRDGAPGNYVDLGPVKATKGSFNQEIPAQADLATVGSVVLWCRAFSVTVTYAPLQSGG